MKLVYPLINIVAIGLVFLLCILSIGFVEKTFGLHTIYRVGDIEAVLFALLYGGFVFNFIASFVLEKCQGNKENIILEHMYQAGGLYLVFVGSILLSTFGAGLADSILFLFSCISFVGIVTNFLTIKLKLDRS